MCITVPCSCSDASFVYLLFLQLQTKDGTGIMATGFNKYHDCSIILLQLKIKWLFNYI